jgi:F-type H+-transporting ATPase subunit a
MKKAAVKTQLYLNLSSNPLEQFEIVEVARISLLGFNWIISNMALFAFVVLTLLTLAIVAISPGYGKLGRTFDYRLSADSLYGFIIKMVQSQLGESGGKMIPFILTLFLVLLVCNTSGLVPYSFTVTAQFVISLASSSALMIAITAMGVQNHGFLFMSLFVPSGTPLPLVPLLVVIETVSYVARAISLGVRLSANLIAGHILLKIIATFTLAIFMSGSALSVILAPVPLIFLILLVSLELGVALLQAYVFVLLTINYMSDALYLH